MDREDLLRRIHEVFPAFLWPRGKLAAVDDSSDLDCQYIIDHYQGKRWTDMTEEELVFMSQDAAYFTQEALGFFFPAWLASDVNGHEHVSRIISFLPNDFVRSCSAQQRMVIFDTLTFRYGSSALKGDRSDPLDRLILDACPTMVGIDAEEWRELSHQEKADLFVEQMRVWRPDAFRLDRTARLVHLK